LYTKQITAVEKPADNRAKWISYKESKACCFINVALILVIITLATWYLMDQQAEVEVVTSRQEETTTRTTTTTTSGTSAPKSMFLFDWQCILLPSHITCLVFLFHINYEYDFQYIQSSNCLM